MIFSVIYKISYYKVRVSTGGVKNSAGWTQYAIGYTEFVQKHIFFFTFSNSARGMKSDLRKSGKTKGENTKLKNKRPEK